MSSCFGRLRGRSACAVPIDATHAQGAGPILVYDGQCGFCTRCARWVEAHAPEVHVVPWQALDLTRVGLTEQQVRTTAYWWEGGVVDGGERAVARCLMRCGRWYAVLGRALLFPGVRPLAAVGYRFVARHRSWFSVLLPGR